MERKDAIKLLGKKFVNIMSKLKVKKGAYNQFGSFYYHTLNDILENLKPLLEAEGCYIVFHNSIEYINDRYYCVSECRLYSFDLGDEVYISSKGYAREALSKTKMDDAQVTGSASTYAKKYALCSLFLIDDGSSDPDSQDNTNNKKQNKSVENLLEIVDGHIKSYYEDKDYNKIVQAFTSLAENVDDDIKSALRNILKDIKNKEYNQVRNTNEYRRIMIFDGSYWKEK
jgi:hypothetical protein